METIALWSYGYPHWDWKKENEYLLENADTALAIWQKNEPNKAFRLSAKKPKNKPSRDESLLPIQTFHI